jgi:hypothetical protein
VAVTIGIVKAPDTKRLQECKQCDHEYVLLQFLNCATDITPIKIGGNSDIHFPDFFNNNLNNFIQKIENNSGAFKSCPCAFFLI